LGPESIGRSAAIDREVADRLASIEQIDDAVMRGDTADLGPPD
jgi:hypothetical protein